MTINKQVEGNKLTLTLGGRLDTITAPDLESVIKTDLEGIDSLALDFAELEYISSAGLRVLLSAHKIMVRRGGMTLKNVNETIAEVFEITGFNDILNIE